MLQELPCPHCKVPPSFLFDFVLQNCAKEHSSRMVAKHKPWTWFQRAQVGSAKSASAIQDSVRIFTSRLEPLSPCHVCLIQVGVPVGAAILGTTFTVLAVSAAKRDQRRFEERSQREHAAEVCLLSRPVWSRRCAGFLPTVVATCLLNDRDASCRGRRYARWTREWTKCVCARTQAP